MDNQSNSGFGLSSMLEGKRLVNLGFKWFKISSPDDGVGPELKGYRLLNTYEAGRNKVQHVSDKLYYRVLKKLSDGCVGYPMVVLFDYKKGLNDRRKIIRVSHDTIHGIRVTIFMRFFDYGDNLYVALNLYVLGDLNYVKFLIKLLITFALLTFFWLIVPIAIAVFMWWKLVWRILYERNFVLALRQEFPGGIGTDLFNLDDITMFAQSTTKLIIPTIKEVFEEEGLPVEQLEEYVANINNIIIETSGGSIYGSAIGMANQIKNGT